MFIGIDIGGTTTRLATTKSLNSPVIENKITFSTSIDFEEDTSRVLNYLTKYKSSIGGIGICIAGRVDETKLLLTHSNNLPHYINKPLIKLLRDNFNTTIVMKNDGIASTLAQAYYTNDQRINFIYITWGTGIAVFSLNYQNGRPVASKLDRNLYYKTWEEEFSGNGIYKRYGEKPETLNIHVWRKIFESFFHELQVFILKSHPQNIIFGGGLISKQWDLFKDIQMNLEQKVATALELTALGEDIGLYGAFAIMKRF